MAEIGVLRLVDQDVIGRLIELVTHPFADAGLLEQRDGAADQIVEIDTAQPSLRARIGIGIVTPDGKRRGEQIGVGGANAQREQIGAAAVQRRGERGIIGILRRLPLAEGAQIAVRLRPDEMKLIERRGAIRRRAIEPGGNRGGAIEAALRPPRAVHPADRVQRRVIEYRIVARRNDCRLDVAAGKAERAADIRLDAVTRRKRRQRLLLARARDPECLRPALAQSQRQRTDRLERRRATFSLGLDQHLGKRLARQHRLFARLEGAETRHQPRLDRERRQQALREAVDRLNTDAAAGRIKHLGKQRSSMRALFRPALFAQRAQIVEQRLFLHPHPRRQTRTDPPGHFGRAGLGEGEAQDRAGIDPAKQQAKHARRQHLRLARARRRGKPDVRFRPAGRRLIAGQRWQGFRAMTAHDHTIRRAASADRNRRKAHIRGEASR